MVPAVLLYWLAMKNVVRIRSLDDLDESKENARYRAAWLAKPAEERTREVRRLSLALYELAHGPCDPRMNRQLITIRHDAV